MGNRSQAPGQTISLPQGGGALKGLGETFSPDLFTGTGNFTVPVELPAGRNGFQPSLILAYSAGNGNGPFGLGWSISIPHMIRKTAKGVPIYDDSKDVFLLSSSEDLVPVESDDIVTYRPRTDTAFARISHHKDLNNDYWELRSSDGLTDYYGTPGQVGDDPAVLADPVNSRRIFAWNVSSTCDTFGNHITYEYFSDQGPQDGRCWSQIYPSAIHYLDYGDPAAPQYLITVRFVYEQRPDPFSDRRAGFEMRTTRRCQMIETFLHNDQGEELLRRYSLHYTQARFTNISLLSEIQIEGQAGTQVEQLPPLQLAYTSFQPDTQKFISFTGPDSPSGSLAHPNFELADIDGNGLPDFLEMSGTAQYWRNAGEGQLENRRLLSMVPAGICLSDPGAQLLDADGDGRIDLITINGRFAGYYPIAANEQQDRRYFHPYTFAPSINLKDPEVRLVDLTGDGVTDAIRAGTRLECFFNDPQQGWNSTREVSRSALDTFPNVSFADQRVQFACMTGDNLQDIVFVSNGHVEYWPSLGHGNWDGRVIMRNSPRFPYGYDPTRVLLADVDGDGVADLVYVDDQKVILWMNQSGNSWSDAIEITGTPSVADANAIRAADMLGNGISGILWSKPFEQHRPGLHFLDFTGSIKPYMLSTIINNSGSETQVQYTSSIRYYLKDEKMRDTRWQTSLPFPVQVVASMVSIDHFTGNRLTSEYFYHHGYWDGVEREFRGFGHVDQRDTLEFKDPYEHFSPPTETRSWFHLGPISDQFVGRPYTADFTHEYWSEDPDALPTPSLPDGLTSRGQRDALRSLRGNILRTELYALDRSERAQRPYNVSEHSYGVRLEVAPQDGRRGVFFPYAHAQRTTNWERGSDPSTAASFIDAYDNYGQPGRTINIAVPRGRNYRESAQPGEPYLTTLAITHYALPSEQEHYIVDRVSSQAEYEIDNDGSMSLLQLYSAISNEQITRRLFSQVFHFYDGQPFEGLPQGKLGTHGALMRTEELALTEALLHEAYRSQDGPPIPPYLVYDGPPPWTSEYPEAFRSALPPLAGYRFQHADEMVPQGYYVTTERFRYDFQTADAGQRGMQLASMDALGNQTQKVYDRYDLLPTKVTDANGLVTTAIYDYRSFQPREFTDHNGNRTAFTYTPLGFTASTIVMGKIGQQVGDTYEAPSMRWIYDYMAFVERRQPISIKTIRREYHFHDTSIPLPQRNQTIESIEYSDGFGRLVQTRTQGEDVRFGDPIFGLGVLPIDQSQPGGTTIGNAAEPGSPPRTVVSGWQIYDNKGRVVEKYEPFFTQGWEYSRPADGLGQRILMSYDPLGRLILLVHPNHSEERTIYGVPLDITDPIHYDPTPWETYVYDANDNAGRTNPEESKSYEQHWNTPTNNVIDALGRVIRTVERNSRDPEHWYMTQSTHDIRGNVLTVTDQMGRTAFYNAYDLLNRLWRTDQLDSGVKRIVMNANDGVVERRDSRGAVKLFSYDQLDRPRYLWARDTEDVPVTLREHLIYGDSPDSGLTPPEAAEYNLLGVLYEHYDEAGLLTFNLYDFKGNNSEKSRQVLSDQAMRASNPCASADRSLLAPEQYQFSSTYDALNRIKTMLYPLDVTGGRKELRPQYHRDGTLRQVSVDGQTYIERIAYDAKGLRTLIAYGNGIMTRYAYEPLTFRIARMRSEAYAMPAPLTYQPVGSPPLQDYGYAYDLVGNPLAWHDRAPGSGVPITPDRLDRSFTYDPLYRLLTASGRECDVALPDPWSGLPRCQDPTRTRLYSETYTYDPAHNLTRLQHQAEGGSFTRHLDLADETNRLAAMRVGDITFAYKYDVNGNITSETTSRHFAWDHSNHMRSFTIQPAEGQEASLTALYSYDGRGQRVKKVVLNQAEQSESTIYLDDIFEVQISRKGLEVVENNTLHIIDNSQRIAMLRIGPPFPGDDTPAVQYQLGDFLTSSNVVIDQEGSWVRREEYTPFGETSFGSFARKRYRFTGKERDGESGLYYFGARYLAPYLGRWTACDPAGTIDGLNLYAYVKNNPLLYIDPDGMGLEGILAGAGARGGGVQATRAVVPYRPRQTGLTRYRPPQTGLTRYRPPQTGLTRYREPQRGQTWYREPVKALAVYRPSLPVPAPKPRITYGISVATFFNEPYKLSFMGEGHGHAFVQLTRQVEGQKAEVQSFGMSAKSYDTAFGGNLWDKAKALWFGVPGIVHDDSESFDRARKKDKSRYVLSAEITEEQYNAALKKAKQLEAAVNSGKIPYSLQMQCAAFAMAVVRESKAPAFDYLYSGLLFSTPRTMGWSTLAIKQYRSLVGTSTRPEE